MVIIIIIGVIINGILCGLVTQTIIEEKGYYENWFWYGLVFGEFAILAAKVKEEKHATSLEYTVPSYLTSDTSELSSVSASASNPSGKWICSKCGRTNQGYTGSCGCGMTKTENEAILKAESAKEAKAASVEEALKEDKEIITAHRIKAYKELLDTGAITQEEFDKKKAELLDISK